MSVKVNHNQLVGNRIPREYFITQGEGESDITVHAGSYHLALKEAGIERANIMCYSSILPAGAVEIPYTPEMVHGEVMESITAVATCEKGERATAGIAYGWLFERETGKKFGGLVCEYNGDKTEHECSSQLLDSLDELYYNGFSEQYELKDRRVITKSFSPKKKYGTAIVAICFKNFYYPELNEVNEIQTNFGDLSDEYSRLDESLNVILPVAYDETSTWIKGADLGPEAIIEASANMELYDIETDTEAYLDGIYTDSLLHETSSPEQMVQAVYQKAKNFLQLNKTLITLGGEHAVSVGAIKAHSEKYSNFSVLQLDAHLDMREEYEGSRYNHACVMARVKEMCPYVQVGIRSMDSSEKPNLDRKRVFFAHDIQEGERWSEDAINQLTENVYITIDLDVFDPSVMPSTGTPEPGGMNWYSVINFLRKVVETKNVVGFDVVELCPNRHNKAPDFLAAKLIYKLLSYMKKFGGQK